MIRKHIYIDNEQDKQVKMLAGELGIKESEVIRRAISDYIKDTEKAKHMAKAFMLHQENIRVMLAHQDCKEEE